MAQSMDRSHEHYWCLMQLLTASTHGESYSINVCLSLNIGIGLCAGSGLPGDRCGERKSGQRGEGKELELHREESCVCGIIV